MRKTVSYLHAKEYKKNFTLKIPSYFIKYTSKEAIVSPEGSEETNNK